MPVPILVALVVVAVSSAPGLADEVTVKGTVLRGTVLGVTSDTMELETEYGKGNLKVPLEDVEAVVTEGHYTVLHGEDGRTRGRLLGTVDQHLLVGEDPDSASRIAAATIIMGRQDEDADTTMVEAMRSYWRYWHGNLDFGLGLRQATTDTFNMNFGFKADRKKAPTRLIFESTYSLGTEKAEGLPERTLDNELKGLARGEYDLTERWYSFASVDGEYDEIERLSIRSVPKAGVGYRIFKSETATVSLETGGAYTYQRYFGGVTEDFPSVVFGGTAEAKLPYGAAFTWRADYLPSLLNWTEDYLIRTSASLSVPIVGFLAFKATVANEYNNMPAAGAVRNDLSALVGLSVVY